MKKWSRYQHCSLVIGYGGEKRIACSYRPSLRKLLSAEKREQWFLEDFYPAAPCTPIHPVKSPDSRVIILQGLRLLCLLVRVFLVKATVSKRLSSWKGLWMSILQQGASLEKPFSKKMKCWGKWKHSWLLTQSFQSLHLESEHETNNIYCNCVPPL